MSKSEPVAAESQTNFEPHQKHRFSDDYRAALAATFVGWMLDAFDFFLVVFCLTSIGIELGVSDAKMALSITATLMFRPLGALLIGLWSDRCGRRIPFIANVLFYSAVQALTATAHTYTSFLLLRALFGIGMGGQWGVGASLAMEKAPIHKRGLLSGLMQQGYASGSIAAAVCYFLVIHRWGWRPLFLFGCVPALLVGLFVYFNVKESEVWKQAKREDWLHIAQALRTNWKLVIYLTAFLTMLHFAAHGTQDMYPTFLERQWGFGPTKRSMITALSMVGAIVGSIGAGYLSDRWGRRRVVIGVLLIGIPLIPMWAYSSSAVFLLLGAFLMQSMVMGAWGVMPAHLAELSPDSVRAVLPGFAYQLGALLSSSVVYLEAMLAQHMKYATAMAMTTLCALILAAVFAAAGRDRLGAAFAGQNHG
jgi:MFS transporter, SHS family, lactate transporter